MGVFQSSARLLTPHAHGAEEVCPWCEQPIARARFEDIKQRMAAEQERRVTALTEQFERDKAAVEAQARAAAEAALAARVAQVQAKLQSQLAEAEAAGKAAQARLAALQAEQQAAVDQRVQELQAGLQRDKDTAVLAERAKVLKLQSELADMQRKLEGKSAHELGEGSEIDLFELLRGAFETDRIQRVPKGVNGADVIHEVIHNGKVCGKIIYDSKNRNAWQNEFVNKLRADKLAQGADHAILSSNKFPKDRREFHFQDGVIVANPARVHTIVEILRGQVVRMHELRVSKEERGQKTLELYAFITSEHCRQLLETVDAQAGRMLDLDAREQEAHRRLWDQRNKLIRSVQKARGDLSFEIDRIIGTAGNGPEAAA
jgi:hypothetical protein